MLSQERQQRLRELRIKHHRPLPAQTYRVNIVITLQFDRKGQSREEVEQVMYTWMQAHGDTLARKLINDYNMQSGLQSITISLGA